MKTPIGDASNIVRDALRTSHNMYSQPKLTVEWNMNRYFNVTADNIPNEDEFGFDPESWPIESIVDPARPTKGILKGRANQASVTDDNPLKRHVRSYVTSPDDIYKYWCSPEPTSSDGLFPTHTDGLTIVRPHILYDEVVRANKIVVKTENSWASPSNYLVRIKTTVGGGWTTIATNPSMDQTTGQLTLWFNGSSWQDSKPVLPVATNVAGIQVQVNSMGAGYDLNGNVTQYYKNGIQYFTTGVNAYFNLIEIAACLEEDMTGRLINVSDTQDMAEKSIVYPLGTILANSGSVTLSNIDGAFNTENTASPYHRILEPNAIFNLQYVYKIGGVDYPVQQFRMYGGPFGGDSDAQVTVQLQDHSKIFNEQKPTPTLWKGRSVAEIIWRICDMVGFVDYDVTMATNDGSPVIDYFWTDGEKTVMEIFDELSRATQTAIYFDEYNRLQIKSKKAAFNTSKTPVWTLRGQNSGAELADIINMQQSDELATNHVTINYQTASVTDWNRGIPKLERVWEPEGTVSLRAAALWKPMTDSSMSFWMNSQESQTWPYTGIVQIEGELIRYEGKVFSYLDGATRKTAVIKSHEDYTEFNSKVNESKRYQNHFTGEFIVAERGLWNSEENAHVVDINGYNVRHLDSGNRRTDVAGMSHLRQESAVRLQSPPRLDSASDLLIATKGAPTDQTYHYYGTRLRFVNSSTRPQQRAGIVFCNNGTSESGYYVEIQQSTKVNRDNRHELIVYNRDGSDKRVANVPVTVAKDTWYDLDVIFRPLGGGAHQIFVYFDGRKAVNVTVDASVQPQGGRFGMFLRGDSEANFEYLYAVRQLPEEYPDEVSFWDRIAGGYTGSIWDTEWVYKWRRMPRRKRKRTKREKQRWAGRFMDEFGPIIHEVREMDVKFDPGPVIHSKLMLSHPQTICTEYLGTAFGAKFILANISRRTAVIHGNDSLLELDGGGGDQVLVVLGRVIELAEAEQVVVKNDLQIKARGKVETEISSQWIQSEAAAKELGKWIEEHWSKGADEQTVEIFGNTLLEVGDVVSVDYERYSMTPETHKYFVVSITTDFSAGITSNIILRRMV